jgi:hypothetical protein
MTLRVSRADLTKAAEGVGIDAERAEALWSALERGGAGRPRFDAVHVLYYVGALAVILGMATLTASQWDTLTGLGIVVISGIYASVFLALGHMLWHRREGLRTPGGLLVTMAVSMTPLIVYGIEKQFGIWPFEEPGTYQDFHRWVRSGWFAMELATVVAGCAALYFYRFPFITAPIAFVLWYLSMDMTAIIFGNEDFAWDERRMVSVIFGLAVIAVAYVVDLRFRREFAFWLYLCGLLAFWGSLSLMDSDPEIGKFFYFVINVGLMALAVFLRRRTFLVFGGLGVIGYVGYLSYELFEDEILFTIALSLIGLAILGLGVLVSRTRRAIATWVDETLPPAMQRLRPE